MSKVFHKEPLFIKAKRENDKRKKFTEKVFYPKDKHASATRFLNNITKKIKFIIIILALTILAIFSYVFINSQSENLNPRNADIQDKKSDINQNELGSENVSDSEIIPQK